jgi:hypothetical protein
VRVRGRRHVTSILILGMVSLSSTAAYVIGRSTLGLPRRSLGAAVHKMLECVGTTLVFFTVNLATVLALILVVRGSTGTFVSVYLAEDLSWLALSLLQGLTFQWWRDLSSPRPPHPSGGSSESH